MGFTISPNPDNLVLEHLEKNVVPSLDSVPNFYKRLRFSAKYIRKNLKYTH